MDISAFTGPEPPPAPDTTLALLGDRVFASLPWLRWWMFLLLLLAVLAVALWVAWRGPRRRTREATARKTARRKPSAGSR
ncbi:hypothetical protein AB0A74_01075 [Saccharothrix sp. NPDC042600]|uniref:hypothetical protein n=1 Tax=Saccharothrix TaxID=2071 RepID=UPI0033C724BC|nr:hypothetical protein GCM10017745_49190 [Saccharothrix mutabilis subsp. capreolus]